LDCVPSSVKIRSSVAWGGLAPFRVRSSASNCSASKSVT
jgi:hypothetical protein